MMQKIYKDDSANDRSDKAYYTTTHTYNSFYPLTEISRTLNPINGRLDTLFKETISFNSETKLNKKIFSYSFTNFNMVFTDMVIQIELEEVGSVVKVKLSRIFALGKFESAMKLNIKALQQGIGGK